jgi:hypothetical protein
MIAKTETGSKGRVVYVIKRNKETIRSMNFLSYEECVQAMINRLKRLKD